MTNHIVDGRATGATIIPFRNPGARAEPRVPAALESFYPEAFWQWAAANSGRIIEIAQQSARGHGISDPNWWSHLLNGNNHHAARLVLAVCHRLDVDVDLALRVAAACELQHAAARMRAYPGGQDGHVHAGNAGARRSDPNASWVTGDLFVALAYEIIAATPCSTKQRVELVTAFSRSTVQALTGKASATLDRSRVDEAIPLYERLIRDEAGPAFALPVESALVLAELPKVQVRRAREAARAFGMALRIRAEVDALLDGCPRTSDLRRLLGVSSAPVVWYLEGADPSDRERLWRLLIGEIRASEAEIRIWVEKIRASPAPRDCERRAARIRHNALELLGRVPPALKECLQYGLERVIPPPGTWEHPFSNLPFRAL